MPKATVAALLGFGLLAAGLAAFPSMANSQYLPCPIRELSGWLCPGCGTLRGLAALLNGDVAAAMAFNALLLPLILVVVLWAADTIAILFFKGPLFPERLKSWVLSLVFAALLVYGVLRNLR